jgi:predicted GTPase
MKFVELARPDIKDEHLTVALEALIQAIQKRIEKHGRAMVASDHEGLGVITEEYIELVDAVRDNDRDAIVAELFDVAVSCVITVASVVAGAEIAGAEIAGTEDKSL